MSATYERELKGILGGDQRVIEGLLKSLEPVEREAYTSQTMAPFLVVRAAGSLGADLCALRHDLSFLVEVKSTKDELLHFTDSPRLREQFEVIKAQCQRSRILPVYALRLKGVRGDAWRLFAVPGMELESYAAHVYSKMPKITATLKGNLVLRWSEGMPLAKFLRLVRPPSGSTPWIEPFLATPSRGVR